MPSLCGVGGVVGVQSMAVPSVLVTEHRRQKFHKGLQSNFQLSLYLPPGLCFLPKKYSCCSPAMTTTEASDVQIR